MPLSQSQAEAALGGLIDAASRLFYDGGPFTVFGAYRVVPRVSLEPGAIPNGNLIPLNEREMGLSVSRGMLAIEDDTALRFALGHELGHGFSEALLTRVGLPGIGGSPTEVIADLGSAYLLSRTGSTWDEIVTAVRGWRRSGIFDENASGDHPGGADRASYVQTLRTLILEGHTFEDAAKAICMSLEVPPPAAG